MKDKYKDQLANANTYILLGLFLIIIYEIEALRHLIGLVLSRLAAILSHIPVIKVLCHFASTMQLHSFIYDYYFIVEILALCAIVICVIREIHIKIKKSLHDKKLRIDPESLLSSDASQDPQESVQKLSGFQEGLLSYLTSPNSQRAFLITGQWGSGKSHELYEFMETFYSESATSRYRISCFGLCSREDIISAINKEIQKADDSLYSKIIELLSIIPVIGDFLKENLSKSYSYTSVPKNSIFIFDDFERITSRSIDSASSKLYQSDKRVKNGAKDENDSSFDSSFVKLLEKNDYDKYIAIVGFMNELIENYNMKVIILCCSDMLGEAFVSSVLRLKLNCIEYVKEPSKDAKESIIKEAIENFNIANDEKENDIEEFVQKLPIDTITKFEPFNNLRFFRNLIDAFIHTANTLSRGMLSNDFLESLFASIAVTYICVYKNEITSLRYFDNGANICMLLETYQGPFDTCLDFVKEIYGNKVRWVSQSISGYWILNQGKRPENELENICNGWNKYKDTDHEKALLGKTKFKPDEVHSITQYIYCFITSQPFNPSFTHPMLGDDFNSYYENAMVSYNNITEEIIAEILDKLSCAKDCRDLTTVAETIVYRMTVKENPIMVSSISKYARVYNEDVLFRKEQEEQRQIARGVHNSV